MDNRTKRYLGLAVAVLLVVSGTLATGLLPSTRRYQTMASVMIVGGFMVGYAVIGSLYVLD